MSEKKTFKSYQVVVVAPPSKVCSPVFWGPFRSIAVRTDADESIEVGISKMKEKKTSFLVIFYILFQ
jgi:hypothetical protein